MVQKIIMKLHEIKLFEAASGLGNKEPTFDSHTVEEAVQLLKSKCSDGVKLIKEDTLYNGKVFYRGDKSFGNLNDQTCHVVDPSRTTRKSENTTNQYTEIFDHHPEMKDWPKRSRSYIATTDPDKASHYSNSSKHLRILIPFNGVKIGFVNETDMWDLGVELFGDTFTLPRANRVFKNDLQLLEWKDFTEFDRKLKLSGKNEDEDVRDSLMDCVMAASGLSEKDSEKLFEKYRSNFLVEIFKAYSPEKLGLTYQTTADSKWTYKSEVWIGGPCVLIPHDLYLEIRKAL